MSLLRMKQSILNRIETSFTHIFICCSILVSSNLQVNRMIKILVLGEFTNNFFNELNQYYHVVSADKSDLNDIDILIVRSSTNVDKNLVDRMPKLKLVISPTHGRDHIDKNYLNEKKIECKTVTVLSYDVAQGVIGYILAHSTNLIKANNSIKDGHWKKSELIGSRVKGKTIGIVGYGKVGKEVAKLSLALGMKVLIYDPYVESDKNVVKLVNLNEVLERSDFVSLCVPLTEETKGMIGKEEFDKMKKGSYLINVSRGEVVDEKALLEALRQVRISGAALDVFKQEPPTSHIYKKIMKFDNVIVTPHSIAQTKESMDEKNREVIKLVHEFKKIE